MPLRTLGTKLRKSGVAVKDDALPTVLGELVESGRAFEHPVGRSTKNASPRYWHRSAEDYVAGALAAALPRQREWTPSQLRRLVPKAYHDLLDERVGRLLEAGELFEAPSRGKTRKLSTSRTRPSEALTAAQLKSLRGVLARVNELRRPALRFEALLEFLDASGEPSTDRLRGSDAEPTEELLLRFYAEDLPRREGLRSMPIPWTWRRYEAHCERRGAAPDLGAFQAMLRALEASRRVALTVHDAPASIPEAERRILETRGRGRVMYYWTPIAPP